MLPKLPLKRYLDTTTNDNNEEKKKKRELFSLMPHKLSPNVREIWLHVIFMFRGLLVTAYLLFRCLKVMQNFDPECYSVVSYSFTLPVS